MIFSIGKTLRAIGQYVLWLPFLVSQWTIVAFIVGSELLLIVPLASVVGRGFKTVITQFIF